MDSILTRVGKGVKKNSANLAVVIYVRLLSSSSEVRIAVHPGFGQIRASTRLLSFDDLEGSKSVMVLFSVSLNPRTMVGLRGR